MVAPSVESRFTPVDVFYTPEIFSIQSVGGISRYFIELIRGLRAAGHHPHVAAGLHFNEHLRDSPGAVGMNLYFATSRAPRWRSRFNRALCRCLLALQARAVIHQTYFGDTSYLRGRPLVITVYDMIHELFHDRFPELALSGDPSLYYKRRNCERADHIITISESTKTDLIRLFDLDPAKVTVIPLANSLPPLNESDDLCCAAPRSDGSEAYLLYVGARGGYKNFHLLLEAFGRSKLLQSRFRLVCFGSAFSSAEQASIAALSLEGRVLQRSGSDKALARCYRGAAAFVCSSLYEGFGLPVLEAMSQGCPVVCARAGSLPEVAGNAAAYFDPQQIESIRTTLEDVMEDGSRLAILRGMGIQRARMFSWDRCTSETLEIYRRFAR